jgi:hypothetical protein
VTSSARRRRGPNGIAVSFGGCSTGPGDQATVYRLDRLARSQLHLLQIMEEIEGKGANHASTRTTQLYDQRSDEVSLDEVERILI